MMDWIDRTVERIVDALTDRKGLRHEWDNIDESIQNEITDQWRTIIAEEATALTDHARLIDEARAALEPFAEIDASEAFDRFSRMAHNHLMVGSPSGKRFCFIGADDFRRAAAAIRGRQHLLDKEG